MFLDMQCNEKRQSYGCSKEFVQSAALHSNDSMGENSSHQGKATGGNNIQRRRAGLTCCLVVGVHADIDEISIKVTSQRRAEQQRREKPSLAGKAGAGNSRSLPRYRYRLLVSLPKNRLLRSKRVINDSSV